VLGGNDTCRRQGHASEEKRGSNSSQRTECPTQWPKINQIIGGKA
jgi:hypothetical protein